MIVDEKPDYASLQLKSNIRIATTLSQMEIVGKTPSDCCSYLKPMCDSLSLYCFSCCHDIAWSISKSSNHFRRPHCPKMLQTSYAHAKRYGGKLNKEYKYSSLVSSSLKRKSRITFSKDETPGCKSDYIHKRARKKARFSFFPEVLQTATRYRF